MSLTQEQIEKLLWSLSKLWSKNSAELTTSVNSIIDYMEILDEVDTTGVKPTVSVVEKRSVLRADIEEEKTVAPADLLACSSQKVVANHIAIPNIMK